TNARIGLGHSALRGGDIRSPLKKFGGNSGRSLWRNRNEGLLRDREFSRRFANQDRNRVFQLCPEDAQIGCLGLGGFKLGLGLSYVLVRSDTGVKADPGQIE